MAAALARHDEIVRAAIDRHGGWIFSVGGDGFGVAFARAGDALASAIDAQRALQHEAWPGPVELRVRMGMHTGEAEERDGTYFGHSVNVAARLMAAAAGGQIIVSEVTTAVIGDVTAAELVDLGRQRLRGLVDPVGASCVKADGLASVDQPIGLRDAVVGRLPRPATSWRGPMTLLNRLGADLSTERLMTFTGPGGIGKSRLAIEVAGRFAPVFADGVWMVELAPIADPGSVVTAIASVFSLHPPAGMSPDDALVEWLRDRHLLLILDNGEHVLAAVRSVVAKIMGRCPHVTTLVTSRAPLELVGERVVVVPMLSMRDAVELFEECAAAVGGPTEFWEADQGAIVSICERLDGIPLAIELAASRVRSLSVTEVLSRLDDRFRLLTRGRHGGVEHHRTLRATVDWSYQLLSDAERALFVRLSVFPGGFDLAAVEAVCADEMLDQSAIVDLVDALVARSMVVADRDRAGIRYRLLETLRDYAREHRPGHVDEDALRSRHLDHYLAVVQYANDVCAGPHQVDGDAVFDKEWDNLRAAHSWAVETKAVGASNDIVALTAHHAFRRYRHEHEVWAMMSQSVEGLPTSATSHGWVANWALLAGDVDRALELAHRGVEVAREPHDPDTTQCWAVVAAVQLATGDGGRAWQSATNAVTSAANGRDPFSRALALSIAIEAALNGDAALSRRLVGELRSLADRVGAPSLLARSSYHVGQQHLNDAGNPDASAARAAYAEGLALAQRVGDLFMAQMNLYGVVEATTAMRVESSRLGVETLTEFRERRNWLGIWALLNVLAEWLAFVGDAEGAATIYGHLEAHHHLPWDTPVVRQRRSAGLAAVRGEAEVEQWMAQGVGMDRDDVVAYAIDRLAERARSTND